MGIQKLVTRTCPGVAQTVNVGAVGLGGFGALISVQSPSGTFKDFAAGVAVATLGCLNFEFMRNPTNIRLLGLGVINATAIAAAAFSFDTDAHRLLLSAMEHVEVPVAVLNYFAIAGLALRSALRGG